MTMGCEKLVLVYGAALTVRTGDQAEVPMRLVERILKYHVWRVMLPVVKVVAFAAAVPDPATVVKAAELLHWIV